MIGWDAAAILFLFLERTQKKMMAPSMAIPKIETPAAIPSIAAMERPPPLLL